MKIVNIFVLFVGCFSINTALPAKFPRSRNSDFLATVNRIDDGDSSSLEDKTHSSSDESTIIIEDGNEGIFPFKNTYISFRTAAGTPPSTQSPPEGRRKFSHFYRTRSEPTPERDPIVFPVSEPTPTLFYVEHNRYLHGAPRVPNYGGQPVVVYIPTAYIGKNTGCIVKSIISENPEQSTEKPTGDRLTQWLRENSSGSATQKPEPELIDTPDEVETDIDIDTHSLYHGPKHNKGVSGKIVCPPGERPSHFGDCKRPVTLTESE